MHRSGAAAALLIAGLMGTGPARADLPILTKNCSIGDGVNSCPQLDPKIGTLLSIDVQYFARNNFAFYVTGETYSQTDYKVTIWQELDTGGGDMASFYMTGSGTTDVHPKDLPQPSPLPTIMVEGSFAQTINDPAKLARFVGTKTVSVIAIAEPATGPGKAPQLGTGTLQAFYRTSSQVSGTITLNYMPVLKRPQIKLPPQSLPKPPFSVPPHPKPKKTAG